MKTQVLLEKLVEQEGTPLEELLTEATYDSVAKGICRTCGEYTTDVEPDANEGYCEECCTTTVVSVLVLCKLI